MYEQLLNLDPIRLNFSANGMRVINFVLALVMFGVALGIKPAEFKNVFKKPKSAILGLTCQLILLLALTFLLIVILNDHITPMVAMGMILVAACPGGNISNFMSSLSKANVELSVTLTAITTSAATFMTPFNFAFWGGAVYPVPEQKCRNCPADIAHRPVANFRDCLYPAGNTPYPWHVVRAFLPENNREAEKTHADFFFVVLYCLGGYIFQQQFRSFYPVHRLYFNHCFHTQRACAGYRLWGRICFPYTL